MSELLALLIGGLAGFSFYLMTSENRFRMLLGLLLLSQAVHLFVFTRGRLRIGEPALIHNTTTQLQPSDPLIQALILTAIVISFAMMSFATALLLRGEGERDENKEKERQT